LYWTRTFITRWMNTAVKLEFQGGKDFIMALSELRTVVTSATNPTTPTCRFTWFTNMFQQRDPPYGMFQCQCQVAGVTAFWIHFLYSCVMCCWLGAEFLVQSPLDYHPDHLHQIFATDNIQYRRVLCFTVHCYRFYK
jgi:hypothetical protein